MSKKCVSAHSKPILTPTFPLQARASAENFPGGGGHGKKDQKLAKNTEK